MPVHSFVFDILRKRTVDGILIVLEYGLLNSRCKRPEESRNAFIICAMEDDRDKRLRKEINRFFKHRFFTTGSLAKGIEFDIGQALRKGIYFSVERSTKGKLF